jgi:hypothetical protein
MLKVVSMERHEREAMGNAGREKMAREFDERIVLNSYVKSITALLGSPPRSAP